MNNLAIDCAGNGVFEIAGLYSNEYGEHSMGIHCHDALVFVYVESGNCKISIHDQGHSNVRPILIPVYNFIVINTGVQHCVHIADNTACRLKVLKLKLATDVMQEIPHIQMGKALLHMRRLQTMLNENWPYMVLCDTISLGRVLTNISQLQEKHSIDLPAEKSLLMHLKINELLLLLDDCILVDGGKAGGASYVIKAQQIIREQLFSPELSPQRVAEEVGITKNYLMDLFQKELGHTVMYEIQSRRIEQACSRILNSDEFLMDIGFSCGFNTRQSFFTNFKKFTGISPNKFRERHMHPSVGEDGGLRKDET